MPHPRGSGVDPWTKTGPCDAAALVDRGPDGANAEAEEVSRLGDRRVTVAGIGPCRSVKTNLGSTWSGSGTLENVGLLMMGVFAVLVERPLSEGRRRRLCQVGPHIVMWIRLSILSDTESPTVSGGPLPVFGSPDEAVGVRTCTTPSHLVKRESQDGAVLERTERHSRPGFDLSLGVSNLRTAFHEQNASGLTGVGRTAYVLNAPPTENRSWFFRAASPIQFWNFEPAHANQIPGWHMAAFGLSYLRRQEDTPDLGTRDSSANGEARLGTDHLSSFFIGRSSFGGGALDRQAI